MKPLDKVNTYYLGNLNDDQLLELKKYLIENDKGWSHSFNIKEFVKDNPYINYRDIRGWNWVCGENESFVDAVELFNEDESSVYDDMLSLIEKGKKQGLKIVVTFEKL